MYIKGQNNGANFQKVTLDEKRVENLLTPEKREKAFQLTFLQRIKDLFRVNKKAIELNQLKQQLVNYAQNVNKNIHELTVDEMINFLVEKATSKKQDFSIEFTQFKNFDIKDYQMGSEYELLLNGCQMTELETAPKSVLFFQLQKKIDNTIEKQKKLTKQDSQIAKVRKELFSILEKDYTLLETEEKDKLIAENESKLADIMYFLESLDQEFEGEKYYLLAKIYERKEFNLFNVEIPAKYAGMSAEEISAEYMGLAAEMYFHAEAMDEVLLWSIKTDLNNIHSEINKIKENYASSSVEKDTIDNAIYEFIKTQETKLIELEESIDEIIDQDIYAQDVSKCSSQVSELFGIIYNKK